MEFAIETDKLRRYAGLVSFTGATSMKTGRDQLLFWLVAVIPLVAVLAIAGVGMIRNLLR
jgi:hypothetical protein